MATALAPTTTPLCAMGVAIAMADSTLCPVALGTLDGNSIMVVGTVQVMSPTSSEAPAAALAPLVGVISGITVSISGCNFKWLLTCTALANAWSSAVHFGMPTALIFS